MKCIKKKIYKMLSVALSVMITATAFTGFSSTNASASTIQSDKFAYRNLTDDTIEITSCSVKGKVEIPSAIDGKKVTSIGEYAFKEGITSVSIPESVVIIQDYAFNNCYSLETINFSEGLKYIGKEAFTGCSLQKLDFPETLEEIDDSAFSSMYNINEISFPESHGVKLGSYAFDRGSWYWESPDGPIISGKTLLYYKSYGSSVEEYTIPDGIESIGPNAFDDLYSTTKINIPDTVKYIGSGAFSQTQITEVVIPDGVETIEDNTFSSCSNLKEVTLPDTITSIGDYAFQSCSSLNVITIPKNVTYIGEDAFSYSGISDFVLSEDNKLTNLGTNALYQTNWFDAQPDGPIYIDKILVDIKSSDGTIINSVDIKDGTELIAGSALKYFTGSISIPDSVKYINDYAFSYTNVTQDDIPANVEIIGKYAFECCNNITEITFPKNLKTIDEYAFRECYNLSSVSESDSLVSIGNYAFSDTQIKTFPVGSSLKSFGRYVFEGNEVLESFTVDINNNYFSVKDDVLYNKDQSIIVCYPPAKKDTTLVITNDIVDYSDAFSSGNTHITEIKIEEGLYTIPTYSFMNLPNVEVITIPTTVTSIGEQIFSTDCSLTTINFNAIDCNANSAFSDLGNLTTVNFGSEVTNVSEFMFAYCSNLSDINFSGNIEFIGDNAFYCTEWDENIRYCDYGVIVYVDKVAYCSNNPTGDVVIKNGTTSIYTDAFSGCEEITSVTLPDSVEYIGYGAFSYCNNLETIVMSPTIEYIGDYAFSNCSNIYEIDLGDNLTYLGSYAFSYCSSLESITVPSGVNTILDNTFSSCSSLTNITLCEGITYIDEYAFAYTGALNTITLPSTVEEIKYDAFYYSGIKNIELNEGLKTIGNYAFEYCEQLESITCPSTLKTIEHDAFYSCRALKNVTLNEGLEAINSYTFYNCTALESIEIPSSVKTIEDDAFEYCTSLKSVTFNEGLQHIETYSFYGCTALESIVLPSTLKTIGASAFSYCESLRDVSLNEGLEVIGNSAFHETAIESIEIPTTIKELDYGVFSNCANLNSVTLHEGLIAIYDGAFQNCTSLTNILIPSTVNYIGEYVFSQEMFISGYQGSYAEDYIYNHWYDESLNHVFIIIERIMGDINYDGVVNITDATELQKHLAGMIPFTDKQLASADITGNGNIDIQDVTYIAKALAGIIEL